MKILVLLGCIWFAGSFGVDAAIVRKETKRQSAFYSHTQISKPEISRASREGADIDRYTRSVRSPERIDFERAPVGKKRRKAHITDWP